MRLRFSRVIVGSFISQQSPHGISLRELSFNVENRNEGSRGRPSSLRKLYEGVTIFSRSILSRAGFIDKITKRYAHGQECSSFENIDAGSFAPSTNGTAKVLIEVQTSIICPCSETCVHLVACIVFVNFTHHSHHRHCPHCSQAGPFDGLASYQRHLRTNACRLVRSTDNTLNTSTEPHTEAGNTAIGHN